jgi:hypothetical protein
LFAFCFSVSRGEVALEVGPGLVGGWFIEPVIAVVVVVAGFVDDGVSSIYDLLVSEGSVASLRIGLDFLDAAV